MFKLNKLLMFGVLLVNTGLVAGERAALAAERYSNRPASVKPEVPASAKPEVSAPVKPEGQAPVVPHDFGYRGGR